MKIWILWFAINATISFVGAFVFRERRHNLTKNDLPYFLIFLLIFFSVFALQMAEIKIDPVVSSSLSLDFTKKIYDLEGNIVALFQSIRNPILDYYFVFVYMIGFPFLLYFTPLLYIISKDVNSLKLVVAAYAIVISIAMPFFLFFPVHDVWWASSNYEWYTGKAVSFRLQEIWPSVLPIFYKFTTLNNCFPSLHSALSATMAYVAWISKYKRYAYVAITMAISIPIATLYLGIHWLTDVIVGEAIALLSVLLALKITGLKWK
jgi:membrane-associated phospholipid phosphatase